MENRIALLGIIVENKEVTDRLNDILHEYADYVVGRMGIPYRERGISIISVVLDAPESAVSALVRQAGNAGGGFCQGRVFQGDGNRRSPVNLDVAAFPHAPDEELAPLLEDLLVRPDFQEVYQAADAVRRQTVGDTVHIRALLEFSNYCRAAVPVLRAECRPQTDAVPDDGGGDSGVGTGGLGGRIPDAGDAVGGGSWLSAQAAGRGNPGDQVPDQVWR